ncbi:MAG: hypothetical protein ACRC1M_00460 [Methanobacteriaceae archaeon]
MKKLLTILMMVVFGMFVFAGEVVVMTSNDTMNTFNRMYSIGTTQEVVVVNNVVLFNEVAVPTFASAKVDGNKMTFVRENDKFASYAVKFVKETRTTYVFVAEANETVAVEVIETLETVETPVELSSDISEETVETTNVTKEIVAIVEADEALTPAEVRLAIIALTLLASVAALALFVVKMAVDVVRNAFTSNLKVAATETSTITTATANIITQGINYEIPVIKLDLNNSLNLMPVKNLSVPVIGIFKVGNSVSYKGFNFVIVAEEINAYRCWNGTYGFFNICKSDMLEGHVINYTMHFEEVCELFMPKDNGPDNKGPKVVSLEITNSEVEYLTPNFDLVVDSSINFIGGLCQHLADYDFHELYEIFEDSEGNCFWIFGIEGSNWKVMNMSTGEVSLLDRNSKRHIYSSILSNFKGWFKVGDSVGYKEINFLIIAENPDSFECYGKGKFFRLSKHDDLPGSIVNYNIGLKEIAELFENK